MNSTKIEWTDKTWNPITGCTKYSSGCQNCYAEIMSKRLMAMHIEKYSNAFNLTLHNNCLNEPLKWKGNYNIFVCSMSDLFHESVPFDFIEKVFDVIEKTPNHRYQILTKRTERMRDFFATHSVPANAWLGTTVENIDAVYRIEILQSIKTNSIRFLSCEPLLSDLGSLNLENIDWVIVGGESGTNARPMKREWILSIKEQVGNAGAAFFFKQWGTWGPDNIKRNKKANGKLLNGQIIQEMPNIKI